MVYLDNSATTKPCEDCVEAVSRVLRETWGNPSSLHRLGVNAENEMNRARASVAALLGCDQKEIIFTGGGSEANNLAVFGTAEALARRGNRVITTAIEHPSVLECFAVLEKRGMEVVRLGVGANGKVSPEELAAAVNEKTVLVSMMYVNNETGAIQPVETVRTILKEKHAPAYFHIDAVQAFGKLPVKPKALGADLISISAHKIHGPKGVGALYKAADCRIASLIKGGGQEKDLRSGTENLPGIAGFGAAAAMQKKAARPAEIASLNRYARERLSAIEGGVILSPDDALPYILNWALPGYRSETLLHFLEAKEIYVSSGSACAKGKGSYVLRAMGIPQRTVDGALRISFSDDNSKEDIDALCDALAEAKATLRGTGR